MRYVLEADREVGLAPLGRGAEEQPDAIQTLFLFQDGRHVVLLERRGADVEAGELPKVERGDVASVVRERSMHGPVERDGGVVLECRLRCEG